MLGDRGDPWGGGPAQLQEGGVQGHVPEEVGVGALQVSTRAHPRPWRRKEWPGPGPRAPGNGQQGPLTVLVLRSSGLGHMRKPAPGPQCEAGDRRAQWWGELNMLVGWEAWPWGPSSRAETHRKTSRPRKGLCCCSVAQEASCHQDIQLPVPGAPRTVAVIFQG